LRRGADETSIVAVPPGLVNAIFAAVDVRLHSLPRLAYRALAEAAGRGIVGSLAR
jgi:CO/xanthine dehydrogenase Mo-binding subunit